MRMNPFRQADNDSMISIFSLSVSNLKRYVKHISRPKVIYFSLRASINFARRERMTMDMKKSAGFHLFVLAVVLLLTAVTLKIVAPDLPEQIKQALSPADNGAGFESSLDCFGGELTDDVGFGKAYSMLIDGSVG
jgi:hypothetical protein